MTPNAQWRYFTDPLKLLFVQAHHNVSIKWPTNLLSKVLTDRAPCGVYPTKHLVYDPASGHGVILTPSFFGGSKVLFLLFDNTAKPVRLDVFRQ